LNAQLPSAEEGKRLGQSVISLQQEWMKTLEALNDYERQYKLTEGEVEAHPLHKRFEDLKRGPERRGKGTGRARGQATDRKQDYSGSGRIACFAAGQD